MFKNFSIDQSCTSFEKRVFEIGGVKEQFVVFVELWGLFSDRPKHWSMSKISALDYKYYEYTFTSIFQKYYSVERKSKISRVSNVTVPFFVSREIYRRLRVTLKRKET